MVDEIPDPIRTPDEHRGAVENLVARIQGNREAVALVRAVERVVRYELAHGVSEESCLMRRLEVTKSPCAGRTAIVSDIHGNHAGLMAALDDIAAQSCARIVCLGDLVEGGPDNEGVVEFMRERAIPCVRGNHDEINDLSLCAEVRRFLGLLPESLEEDDVLFIHISPRPKKRKIDHAVEAWNVFDEYRHRLTFVGHTHIPHIFGQRSTTSGEAFRHAFEYNRPFALDPDDRYIVSVGSIGYGRDLVGKIRYCIHDPAANTVEIRAIDGPLLSMDCAPRNDPA